MNSDLTSSPELVSRLTPLFDGRPGIRGTIHVDVSESPAQNPGPSNLSTPPERSGGEAVPQSNPAPTSSPLDPQRSTPSSDSASSAQAPASACILDFTSSDDTLDRFGEIIVASGWQLANYQRNPVFQNAHQYGDVIFTLGRALITEIRSSPSTLGSGRSTCLYQRIQFATDVNPMARIAYGLYKGKFLNAVSVGFIPVRWENGGPDAGYRRKYLEQELLEVSAVAIPANPNALALGLKSGAVDKSDLRELTGLIRLALEPFCGTRAGSETNTRALGFRAYEAQLLQLARALKEALRR
jgi:hypothetical protein